MEINLKEIRGRKGQLTEIILLIPKKYKKQLPDFFVCDVVLDNIKIREIKKKSL